MTLSTFHHRPAPSAYTPFWLMDEFAAVERSLIPSRIRGVTADYTVLPTDDVLLVDATSAPVTITLASAAQLQWRAITIKKIDASAHAVTIGATVDGTVHPTLTAQYAALRIMSDGTTWWILARV